MPDIDIEIDGKALKAKPDSMIIQVADEAGIYIPRFCYHKHLSIAANCRMCLVEVEKSPKTLPACATPVMPGMKVFTRSAKALEAQKAVMEFLLINHPLDCPICDQGGECELQDLSLGYGSADSVYREGKRAVKDQDIGPLVATEMTRCIQCTRCVRFGDEVAGLRELGAVGRGEHMEIGTYVQHALHSEVSGNIIDICPVGALTSKPFRFAARPWELDQHASIAPHDCVGSNINVHTRYGKVMRVVPRENAKINETWISDRDRFSYEAVYCPDRIEKPRIRIKEKWQETDWQTALLFAAGELKKIEKQDIAALASPSATLEEFYLLQKLIRQLGSNHIDHRLRQIDFSDQAYMPLFPGFEQKEASFVDLENAEQIFLIGSHIQKEQPAASLRIRKATLKGAKVISINMMDYQFHFKIAAKKITAPHHFIESFAGLVKAITPEEPALKEISSTQDDEKIAQMVSPNKKTIIILGALALNHPEASIIRALSKQLAKQTNAELTLLTEGANAAGAWIAGFVPHRMVGGLPSPQCGLDANAMLQQPRKAYFLLNVEPNLDCANPVAAISALKQAECVISLSMFKNPVIEQHANVILPICSFTETAGTYVNAAGEWQGFRGMATPFGESRPAWKVLRVLGNFLHLTGFDYESSEEVLEAIQLSCQNIPAYPPSEAVVSIKKSIKGPQWTRIGEIPLYSIDSLVRRAKALQDTQVIVEGKLAAIRIHPKTAEQLAIKENEILFIKQNEISTPLPVVLDKRVPLEAAFIAGGILKTEGFSELFGPIKLNRLV